MAVNIPPQIAVAQDVAQRYSAYLDETARFLRDNFDEAPQPNCTTRLKNIISFFRCSKVTLPSIKILRERLVNYRNPDKKLRVEFMADLKVTESLRERFVALKEKDQSLRTKLTTTLKAIPEDLDISSLKLKSLVKKIDEVSQLRLKALTKFEDEIQGTGTTSQRLKRNLQLLETQQKDLTARIKEIQDQVSAGNEAVQKYERCVKEELEDHAQNPLIRYGSPLLERVNSLKDVVPKTLKQKIVDKFMPSTPTILKTTAKAALCGALVIGSANLAMKGMNHAFPGSLDDASGLPYFVSSASDVIEHYVTSSVAGLICNEDNPAKPVISQLGVFVGAPLLAYKTVVPYVMNKTSQALKWTKDTTVNGMNSIVTGVKNGAKATLVDNSKYSVPVATAATAIGVFASTTLAGLGAGFLAYKGFGGLRFACGKVREAVTSSVAKTKTAISNVPTALKQRLWSKNANTDATLPAVGAGDTAAVPAAVVATIRRKEGDVMDWKTGDPIPDGITGAARI